MYFINGTMDAILNNLSKIEALRVISRTSVEQYREHPKSILDIGKEMNVSYILEGSGLRHGDNIRLNVQLIDAINDRHIWSESYEKKIDEVFELYSEVAQIIAKELEAKITPEEKQRIEKLPTSSIIAFEFWQKAKEQALDYLINGNNQANLRSRDLCLYALEYDSTFADPYVGLAWYYWYNYVSHKELSKIYLDTVQILVEKALSLDDQLAEAYNLRGYYHRKIGEDNKAVEDFNLTLQLKPNMRAAIHGLAWVNWTRQNLLETISYFHKAAAIDRGPEYSKTLRYLGQSYFLAGYKDQADYYSKLALDQDNDSVLYYINLALSEWYISGDYTKSVDLLKRGFEIDPENLYVLQLLGNSYLAMGQYAESASHYKTYTEALNRKGSIDYYSTHKIGLTYWKMEIRSRLNIILPSRKGIAMK